MQARLDYGKRGMDITIPVSHFPRLLTMKVGMPLADPAAEIARVLQAPTGCAPLAEIACGKRTACVLICDVTRPVPNALLLPPLLAEMERAGIARQNILILVATGLHRPNEGAELEEMVGSFVMANYRIENHDGRRLDQHAYLGESPRGVPIWIDQRYVEADLKVTVGLIEPHFMAGYSGGRKLICPGIAALETIRVWHGPRFLEHPLATTGVLHGNPVHEENTWIARRAGCDFILNVVLNEARRPLKIVGGEMEAAFHEGVDTVRELARVTVPEPQDIVVTSAAGYPLDTTFYQAIKGMVAAAPIVKPGGTIIIAASLSEGLGSPEFQRVLDENRNLDEFLAKIQADYFVMDQWQLEEMAKAVRRAKIRVVTEGLPAAVLNRYFVTAHGTFDDAFAAAVSDHGLQATVAVVPKGPYVVAEVEG
jgi:nickel-dependent lactate racemase